MSYPNFKLQIGVTVSALLATAYTWLMLNVDLLAEARTVVERGLGFQIVPYPYAARLVELVVFAFVINFLLYGSAVFIVTRLGYLRRQQRHRQARYQALARLYDRPEPPALTILVPSYKEEPHIVQRTLLSAALLEYPRRRVVLLIDDPPHPQKAADMLLLHAARQLPGDIDALLRPQAELLAAACAGFEARAAAGELDVEAELVELASLYQKVAFWFEEQARRYPVLDHASRFYVEEILRRPAKVHRRHAQYLLRLIQDPREPEDAARLGREYRRLAGLFEVELASFERKQYENLSHESNKAMNLNSYIGLIGGEWSPFTHGGKRYLQAMPAGEGALRVPDAGYIITLDADSLLLHDYALRLVHELERPGRERVGIIQTPYSAFPGAPIPVETIAGAQTDMQYVVHQGFTAHDATFWVGANALLRKQALDDIMVEEVERGHVVKKYIQDRTVIEDTESSIDLVERGWQLCNYPARLAYSATPPDFGSLLIQRRRWANGGLLIFPKMARYVLRGPGRLRRLPEGFLRSHYLISTALTNLGLLLLILYGFDPVLLSPWLIVAVTIYFLVYALSLKEAGYRRRDLFRVWALNLLLIPVNLAGALKSVQQGITGRRVPFGRTPKVAERTATPGWLVLFEVGLAAYCVIAAAFDALDGDLLDAGFAALNGVFLFYGITTFMGWANVRDDIRLALPRLFRPPSEREIARRNVASEPVPVRVRADEREVPR